jgi:scyllo-inositol 2-dehydrogenase (NADP+)
VVTTPSHDHYAFVRDALMAGKHVVVEKPFTVTSEEAGQLMALAGEKGKVLSVYHNRRWDGDFLTVRELVGSKRLGRLFEAEFNWHFFHPEANPHGWRQSALPGSGTFYDLGVHLLDQALTLFGLPATIQADVRKQRERAAAVDYFDVTLGYRDGFKVRLKSSMTVKEPRPRFALYGSHGSFVKYGKDPQEEALFQGKVPGSTGWGEESAENWGRLRVTDGPLEIDGVVRTLPGDYAAYYRNIRDVIAGHEVLAVKPEEASEAIRLIELAEESSRIGKTINI